MGKSRCENFTLGQNRFGGRFSAVLHCYYYPVFGDHFLVIILLFICGYFSELENGARGLRTWAQNVGSELVRTELVRTERELVRTELEKESAHKKTPH